MPATKKTKVKFKKGIAVFMLFTLLNQTFAPTVAYALTAGPTAPEATNFEPIDTTDMVNPLTGSFTYGLPLLEVPGPEGSYPLALSYHAGIQPNEEASWVGLGWSLNPGAIARNVNGYPDDWNNVAGTERDYWTGGTKKTESISVNIGLGTSPASVSFGLSFAQDTYRGFGIGMSAGFGERIGDKNSPFGFGVGIGVDPYGGAYAGADLTVTSGKPGSSGLRAAGSIGISTNFQSISYNAGLKVSAGMLGASINTNGARSFSIGGDEITSVNNANAGKISTTSSGFSIPIPTPIPGVTLGLGYNEERYWSDETTGFMANGVLHSRASINSTTDLNLSGDDNYSLFDPDISMVDNPDPVKQLGGTYPDFDNYSVAAQGLGGNMRPYIFSAILYNQNAINNNNHNGDVYGESLPTSSSPNTHWQFRFINDMSNSYRQQHPWSADQTYNFDANPQYGNNDGPYGYDQATNRLEGSSHIEYFTNDEIADTSATSRANSRGFIRCPETGGFKRKTTRNWNAQLGSQIGGFMITNNSGVTYHYALPAYSYSETVHSENINTSGGYSYNQLSKTARYAYTWYLTAITGPDYVNRGAPGLINPNDWGYWVKFDYGQWTDSYGWRNPSQGFQRDIDNSFQSFSMGQKELYYLDAIETRSHTAIFEKEMRLDGKSNTGTIVGNGESPALYTSNSIDYCPVTIYNSDGGVISYNTTETRQIMPRSTMRLDNIYIFANSQLPTDINTIRQSSPNYNVTHIYTASNTCDVGEPSTFTDVVSQGQNVIDINDIAQLGSGFTSKCLRKIAFNYDYSLTPGVTNSYDPANPSVLTGKLTLLSVDFQGKGATPMTPPIQFQYDLDPTDPKNTGVVSINGRNADNTGTVQFSSATAANFSVGDIIRFTTGGVAYYCVLTSTRDNVNFNVHFIGTGPSTTPSDLSAVKTKNPPYYANAYDNWGAYKSDYTPPTDGNENLSRFTTAVSNKSVDVWSLRKIQSSIGADININYEGNTYNRSVLNKNPSIIVSGGGSNNITINGNNVSSNINSDGTIDLMANNPQNEDLGQIFNIRTSLKGPLIFYREQVGAYRAVGYQLVNLDNYPQTKVVSITGNVIKVSLDPNLIAFLNSAPLRGNNNYNTSPVPNAAFHISVINFSTGNLSTTGSANTNYGGGVRIKSVLVDDLNGNAKQTCYNYGKLVGSTEQASTSGVTSYIPTVFDPDNLASAIITSYLDVNNWSPDASLENDYRSILYKDINHLLAISREIPSPGVMYEYVTVSDNNILQDGTIVPANGSTSYQYEVFKPEMIGIYDYSDLKGRQPYSGNGPLNVSASHLTSTINGQAKKDRSIKDYTSRIGNLKRTITYDNLGNKLTEKINHYLYDDLENTSFENQVNNYEPRLASTNYNGVDYNDIGVVMERYGNSRFVVTNINTTAFPVIINYVGISYLMISDKETYPSIQTGTTQIDYKNGTRMDQSNLAYDYYTGAVTKALTTDSYGNRFINQVTPAYMAANKGAYPALGLKTFDDDPTNTNYTGQHKQMITQQASNYTFSADANNTPIGVVTASVQTWGNDIPVLDNNDVATIAGQANIWRMKANYQWMPTGTSANNVTPYASFADYYSTGGSSNVAWKKTAQITQYNVYSASLEGSDINNNYSAVHMGYNSSKVIVAGAPAMYNEIAYAGAEDPLLSNGEFSSNVFLGSGTINTNPQYAHTGTNSLQVAPGQNGFYYVVPFSKLNRVNQNYSAAVWVYPTPSSAALARLYYKIGSTSSTAVYPAQTINKTAAGWCLLEITVPASAIASAGGTGSLVVGCINAATNISNVYFDDFRFQPTSSASTAYVYDNITGELSYMLDNNNLYTHYQYDAIGRLIKVYKEVLGKTTIPLVKDISYNYGRSVEPNWQNDGNVTFVRQGGIGNIIGSNVEQKDINPHSPTYNQTRQIFLPL